MSTTDTFDNANSVISKVIDDGSISVQQLLVVSLCLIFNMIDGFDITAMAIVASSVASDLALAPDKLGWIFSFALAGMMAGAMVLGPVSDIIGRRKVVIFSLALVAVSILFTARASTLSEFILLRFISGMGAGAMLACQAALAAEYSPAKFRVFSIAAVTSGYPLGAMMTSVFAGQIMPQYGWQGMFVFGGAMTVLMTLIAWLFIPESLKYLLERRPADALPRINRILLKLKKDTLATLPEITSPKRAAGSSAAANVVRLLAAEHRIATLTLWAAFFLGFCTLYFLMSWIPKLMDDSGYDAAIGHQAFFLFNLGGVIGIYLMGWLSTRWSLSNLILILLVSSALVMAVFAAAPNKLNLLLGLITLIGVLQQGGFTGLYGAAAKVYPTAMRSTGIGWAIGLGRSGAVAGPAIAGYLIAAGFDMSDNFYFFAVPMAVSGFIAYRLKLR
jgi:benzoate transport